MNQEQIICPNCQRILKLCECDFEIQEQFLRDLRNQAYKNEPKNLSYKGKECNTYSVIFSNGMKKLNR